MKSLYVLFSFLFVGLILSGCDSNDDGDDFELPLPQVFNEADYTVLDSGLRYIDFVEGDTTMAPAESGTSVLVHYSGWLENGFMFDSSVFFAGRPFNFLLGRGQVIRGWDEGIVGMYPGGQRQLVIPPALAYGQIPRQNIPANSTLIFEVQYIGVNNPQ